MGRLVADAGKRDWDELTAEYGAMLMEGLGVPRPEHGEGTGTRDRHRLFQHVNRHPVPEWVPVPSAAWVHQQVYLHRYPKELMLRNHV
jgi:uncharacterized protein YbgA (DUF1722 family)